MKKLFSNSFAILCATIFMAFGFVGPTYAALPVEEGSLEEGGAAYEINPYREGGLWISDFSGEIWHVKPFSPVGSENSYTSYTTSWVEPVTDPPGGTVVVTGNPSDARRDGSNFWWVDAGFPYVGRASVTTGEFTLWEIRGAKSFYGTAIAPDGSLWFTDDSSPKFYKLKVDETATSGDLCTYTIPLPSPAFYLAFQSGYLWMAVLYVPPTPTPPDPELPPETRIFRLNVATNQLDWWTLPVNSDPFGLAIDAAGDLWYADTYFRQIVKLDVGINKIIQYTVPEGTSPWMITHQGGKIWFSGFSSPTISLLNPQSAGYTETAVPTGFIPTHSPDCKPINPKDFTPGVPDYLPIESGLISWSPNTYSQLGNSTGWLIYPIQGSYMGPWGITSVGNKVWAVDPGLQRLIEIDTTITACKLADADGSDATPDDQTPVAGWGMTLFQNNVSQGQQFTGADGCTHWTDIALDSVYKVVEETRVGWTGMTPSECILGIIDYSGGSTCIFVNHPELKYVFLPLIQR